MLEQIRYTDYGALPIAPAVGVNREQQTPYALRFSANNARHINAASRMLLRNKVGAIAFNGIYGLFTNAEDDAATQRIMQIKERPNDKNLILVSTPEHLDEHVDFEHSFYSHEQVAELQKYLYALGVIMPSSPNAPAHLVANRNDQQTILSIWTEYPPLRKLITEFRAKGGRALAGTSANKSGQPTHVLTPEMWEDFKTDVDFTVEADYSGFPLPDIRRRSTSVIDLTKPRPRLHRLGNVTQEEIQEGLLKFKFPDLQIIEEKTIFVRPR